MSWTVAEVKAYAIEAYETSLKIPGWAGPAFKSGYWPEHSQDYGGVKIRLTPEQISECNRFWDAFRETYIEIERKDLLKWLEIKTSKHKTLRDWAEKNGLTEVNYARAINKLFQKLADRLGSKEVMQPDSVVDQAKKTDDKKDDRSSLQHSPTSIIMPGARPEIEPDAPRIRYLNMRRSKCRKRNA